MAKVTSLILILIGLLILQASVLPSIIPAAVPNVLLAFVVGWAFYRKRRDVIIYSLAAGVLLDLFSAVPFGVYTLSFVVTAFVVHVLVDSVLSREQTWPVIATLVLGANVVSTLISIGVLNVLHFARVTPVVVPLSYLRGTFIVEVLGTTVLALLMWVPVRSIHEVLNQYEFKKQLR